jgi:chromosome segregation ATPase
LSSLGDISISEQLEKSNSALKSALSRLAIATPETKEWGKAMQEVDKATDSLFKNITTAQDKIKKAHEDTKKAADDYYSALIKNQRLSVYEIQRILEVEKERASWSILTAKTPEKEIEALQKQIEIDNKLLELGIKDNRINDEIVSSTQRIYDLRTRIAEQAEQELYGSGAVETMDQIKSIFGEIPSHITDMNKGLSGPNGFNDSLVSTQENLEVIRKKLEDMKLLIENMPKLDIGDEGSYSYSERDNRRG